MSAVTGEAGFDDGAPGDRASEVVVALLRTADLLRRHFASVLHERDVTLQQYNVLRILRGAGSGGLPTLAIGERMIERTPGVTRIVDRLEDKGWVGRERGEEDRRQVICCLTPEGRRLLKELDGPVGRADLQVIEGLEASEVRRLLELLGTVQEALASRCGG